MPSRLDFLTNGLVPVNTTRDQECSVCLEELTKAVQIPACRHIFDHDCLSRFLNQKGRNTCPNCRTKLFDLPNDEVLVVPTDRRTLIANAIRNSRLGEQNADVVVSSYGSTGYNVSDIMRSTAHATRFLGSGSSIAPGSDYVDPRTNEGLTITGPAVIRAQVLSSRFVAMANLIPAYATAQGRAYSADQTNDWRGIMTELWRLIKSRDGKKYDVSAMPAKLREAVEQHLAAQFSDFGLSDFLFRYVDPNRTSPHYEDLQLLLNYLTLCCWEAQRAEQRQEENRVAAQKAAKESKKREEITRLDVRGRTKQEKKAERLESKKKSGCSAM